MWQGPLQVVQLLHDDQGADLMRYLRQMRIPAAKTDVVKGLNALRGISVGSKFLHFFNICRRPSDRRPDRAPRPDYSRLGRSVRYLVPDLPKALLPRSKEYRSCILAWRFASDFDEYLRLSHEIDLVTLENTRFEIDKRLFGYSTIVIICSQAGKLIINVDPTQPLDA